jgi:uncharacterized membrane protein YdfJ with MMPL/SSD domain
VSHLLGTSGALLFSATFLSNMIVKMSLPTETSTKSDGLAGAPELLFNSPSFWLVPAALVLAGIALVFPSMQQLMQTGATYEHWSRFIVMSFLCSSALILLVTKVTGHILHLVKARLKYLEVQHANILDVGRAITSSYH